MRIHKEGRTIIPIAILLLTIIISILWLFIPYLLVKYVLTTLGIIFIILVVRFFRDPVVTPPGKVGVVYAPADGKVVIIKKTVENEYLHADRMQISIFMSPLNVHVNRSPIEGVIDYYKYHPGKYLVAWHPKSSIHNERTSIGINNHKGIQLLMRQIAGTVARRIAFYPTVGDQISQGKSIGFIRFGSRVDLFLPLDSKIKVKCGDKTIGGVTEIATIIPS